MPSGIRSPPGLFRRGWNAVQVQRFLETGRDGREAEGRRHRDLIASMPYFSKANSCPISSHPKP
jgi:hypothetical protein